MAEYRLTNRQFSRLWRRSKDYSDHEIRFLAKRRGLEIDDHKSVLTVIDPKNKKVVATFKEVQQAAEPREASDRTRVLASL